jgi:hypothetical protein
LDQRCRKFLARLADRQSMQQQQMQQLMPPGARSSASLAELSDSASDGDQEQDSHSLLESHKAFGVLQSTAEVGSTVSAADSAIEQCMSGALGALSITGTHEQQRQEQPDTGDSSIGSHKTQQPGLMHSVLDAGSDVVFEVQPGASSSNTSLPRFGFRPGYKPVGIHMPPSPGQDTLALLQQTTGSRSSRIGSSMAAAQTGRHAPDTAAVCAPLGPASNTLAAEQQQQLALQQLAAKVHHYVALARTSPGLRTSSESIIGDAAPASSCHDARCR